MRRPRSCSGRSVVLALLGLAVGMAANADSPPAPRPNIVLIMADDMGFSDIGCYGAGIIRTPHLDRLAAEGVRFTQFYNNAKCTTTRASLLTGLYPRNGGRGIAQLLTPEMLTIGEAMRLAGYRTSLSGKWHNGSAPGQRPCDRGFDESFGLWDGCCNFFDPARRDPKFKGGAIRFFGRNDERITEFPDDFFTTDAFTDHAVAMIQRFAAEGRPFLAYVPYTAPHYPIQAREEDIAEYRGRFAIGWDALQKERHRRAVELGIIDPAWTLPERDPEAEPWESAPHREWQNRRMETYAAMITAMDRGIGRILSALEEAGAADNTLVLFLSDNGSCAETPGGDDPSQVPGPAEYYTHVGPSWAFAQNAPFRRYKSLMHEGGIATPFIARWPDRIRPGTITHQVGHIIDLLPTFLDLAGQDYPTTHAGSELIPLEGRSLGPIFDGGTREPPDALFWFFNGSRAIREGKWKLVWEPRLRKWELYDMEADRTETRDLADQHPDRAARMAARWEQWARETGVRS